MAEKEQEKTKLTVVKDDKEEVKEVKKPTPEEVEEYKNDFSNALKTFEASKWQISEAGQFGVNDVGIFLMNFMEKYAFWSKTEWMGLIKMEDEIKKAMTMSDPSIGIALNYQALEFCAYMLANPGGTGIKLAKEFETQADKYAKVGMVVGSQIEEARKRLKDLQYLQEKWAAAEQGFYLADLEPVKEEKPEEKPVDLLEGKAIEIDLTQSKTFSDPPEKDRVK
jgi:hypothetical protein